MTYNPFFLDNAKNKLFHFICVLQGITSGILRLFSNKIDKSVDDTTTYWKNVTTTFLWLHGKSIIQTLLRRRCKNIECIFRYKTITLFIAYVVLGCPHGLLSIFT